MSWDKVEEWLPDAKAITWDTCHKIYVLMDDEQIEIMRDYQYDPILLVEDLGVKEAFQTLIRWFHQSCGLRFINAIETNHEDPNAGFTSLIAQGEGEDEEDEE